MSELLYVKPRTFIKLFLTGYLMIAKQRNRLMPWVVQGIVPAYQLAMGFPGGSDGNETACNAGNLGQEDPLEKEMAIHSSILAWKILWPEEPGSLQSMGLQRVRHD